LADYVGSLLQKLKYEFGQWNKDRITLLRDQPTKKRENSLLLVFKRQIAVYELSRFFLGQWVTAVVFLKERKPNFVRRRRSAVYY
jgi:hypothetical protein